MNVNLPRGGGGGGGRGGRTAETGGVPAAAIDCDKQAGLSYSRAQGRGKRVWPALLWTRQAQTLADAFPEPGGDRMQARDALAGPAKAGFRGVRAGGQAGFDFRLTKQSDFAFPVLSRGRSP